VSLVQALADKSFGAYNTAVALVVPGTVDSDSNSGLDIDSVVALVDTDLAAVVLDSSPDSHAADRDIAVLDSIAGLGFVVDAVDFAGIAGQGIVQLLVVHCGDDAHLVQL
jgi:hypothetical protein